MTAEERRELEEILGHSFARPEWLERALTHRSCRQGPAGMDNERLEFLGDRVVGLVASEELFRAFPHWEAGKLSKGLARLVSASTLQEAARRLGLGRFLQLGAGEEKTGGREKKRLLADAYEAVTGAMFLDAGLGAAVRFLRRTLIGPVLAGEWDGLDRADYKSALQELLQQRGLSLAAYRVRQESGPEHRKTFEVEVWLEGRRLAAAEGRTKKEAEQSAAKLALENLAQATETP